ncbi:hypothetical protein DEO23_12645 [Brachybacterium endophyticum]|uniref:N-acetyltransferase domain-containing protein n=1 Tax=Brachybacterium endophyticum TaxID=2182385 RepID=A0A2U2RI33_9MICO|nr:GNAT family N-acetyltransferase [Brachybacterium endophyticum]PWH05425.1 hypothetical protein DEO23_12645 [Brachybacterium endophyticum]
MTPKTSRSSRTKRKSAGARRTDQFSNDRLVETLVAGWRPLSRLDVDGFAILRSRGVSRRANCIVPIDPPSDPEGLAAALDRVLALSSASGERELVRILPDHGHEGVDAALADRGFTIEAPCDLLELPLDQKLPAPDPRARIETGPLPEDWFTASWRLSPRDGDGARETLHDILAGTPAVHVAIDEEPPESGAGSGVTLIAVGRAALVDHGRARSAVLNQIATDPDHRGEGLATAVVGTLLAAASVQGATRALLEVETDNAAALALYRKLGSRRIGAYHYRVEE